MKKLGLMVMPLMAVSFLTNCGGGSNPEPDPKSTYTVTYVNYDGTELQKK